MTAPATWRVVRDVRSRMGTEHTAIICTARDDAPLLTECAA